MSRCIWRNIYIYAPKNGKNHLEVKIIKIEMKRVCFFGILINNCFKLEAFSFPQEKPWIFIECFKVDVYRANYKRTALTKKEIYSGNTINNKL